MRRIDDKTAYIKEIQRFLAVVVDPSVFETGEYDEKTKEAVIRFKSDNGMTADSTLDYEAYSALYAAYSESGAERTLRRSDTGDDVLSLNTQLSAVGSQYSDVPMPGFTRYFSMETEGAVMKMRRIYGMPDGKEADPEFIRRLDREYTVIGKNAALR